MIPCTIFVAVLVSACCRLPLSPQNSRYHLYATSDQAVYIYARYDYEVGEQVTPQHPPPHQSQADRLPPPGKGD